MNVTHVDFIKYKNLKLEGVTCNNINWLLIVICGRPSPDTVTVE